MSGALAVIALLFVFIAGLAMGLAAEESSLFKKYRDCREAFDYEYQKWLKKQ